MALAPAGPPGWVIIGILLLIDVALITVVITDINQTHTSPMTTSDGNLTHTSPMTTSDGNLTHTLPMTTSDGNLTHTSPMTTSDGNLTHTSPMATDEGRILVLQAAQTEDQILKSIRTLQAKIAKHEAMIAKYTENPDAMDNQGRLANAQNETIRNLIIEGRIYAKQKEIRKFQNEINKLLNRLNKLK